MSPLNHSTMLPLLEYMLYSYVATGNTPRICTSRNSVVICDERAADDLNQVLLVCILIIGRNLAEGLTLDSIVNEFGETSSCGFADQSTKDQHLRLSTDVVYLTELIARLTNGGVLSI